MPLDLAPLLSPPTAALVVFECLDGTVGERSLLPGLAAAAAEVGIVDRIGALIAAARPAGVRVFHCTIEQRRDGTGRAGRTPLERRLAESGSGAPPDLGNIVQALEPAPEDLVVSRRHGLTGFFESGLDMDLRAGGIETIVLTGVSLNVGLIGTAIEAANRGFAVVVPTDCVASDPPEYAASILRWSFRNLAYLTDSDTVCSHWAA